MIEHTILPIRRQLDWGPSIPYYLTGQMNLHPRTAMSQREGAAPDAYLEFFDRTLAET